MLPQNHIVILSSDAEGNNFHKLSEVHEGAVDDLDSYYVEFNGYPEEPNVVVLWP